MSENTELPFKGHLKHFSDKVGGLAVDYFMPYEGKIQNLNFISHAHTDHLKGIYKIMSDPDYRQSVKFYSSRTTYDIITKIYPVVKELEGRFTFLEPNTEVDISLMTRDDQPTDGHVTVQTIPANHIPGAMMFMFRDGVKRCLYTGDFRYDTREDNEEMRKLKDFVENCKGKLDYLYVDVTCRDTGNIKSPDQNKLPSRPQITDAIHQRIVNRNKKQTVHLDVSILGSEALVSELARRFSQKTIGIPLGDKRKDCLEFMLKDVTLVELSSPTDAPFLHISSVSLIRKGARKCVVCNEDTLKIRATLLWAHSHESEYKFSSKDSWLDNDHIFVRALLSHHSSHLELEEFLSLLTFDESHPINKSFEQGTPISTCLPNKVQTNDLTRATETSHESWLLLTGSILAPAPTSDFSRTRHLRCIKKVIKRLIDIFNFEPEFGIYKTVVISAGVDDLYCYGLTAGTLADMVCERLHRVCWKHSRTQFIFNSVLNVHSDFGWLNDVINTFNGYINDLAQSIPNMYFLDSHAVLMNNKISQRLEDVIDLEDRRGVRITWGARKLITNNLVNAVARTSCLASGKSLPPVLRNWQWPLRQSFRRVGR